MTVCRITAPLLALVLFVPAGVARADDGFFLSVGHPGKRSFYMSVGAHYRVPEKQVAFVCRRGIPDEEMPVVFYLAARARVKPAAIVDLRLAKKSWAEITLSFGLGADVFYVPVKTMPRPPYGNAWGHFKKHPKSAWKSIVLPDRDVVSLVSLRFISKHHGFSPEAVIKARVAGQNLLTLHGTFATKAKERRAKSARSHAGKKAHKAAKRHGKHGGGSTGKGRKGGKGRRK